MVDVDTHPQFQVDLQVSEVGDLEPVFGMPEREALSAESLEEVDQRFSEIVATIDDSVPEKVKEDLEQRVPAKKGAGTLDAGIMRPIFE